MRTMSTQFGNGCYLRGYRRRWIRARRCNNLSLPLVQKIRQVSVGHQTSTGHSLAGIRVSEEGPAQPEIVRMLRRGEEHMAQLYPSESNHLLPLELLTAPDVRFYVARGETGEAFGTGALVLHGSWAEIKRMWVNPEFRGLGFSKTILATLEDKAFAQRIRILRVETGVRSVAALRLYTGAGFVVSGPFADYRPDPLSVFMRKSLRARSSERP
jgi:putative acetyltransferase